MINILAIFIGGGLGSVLRYVVSKGVLGFYSGSFPLGTFIANILSCIVLALVVLITKKSNVSEVITLFLLTGFCGGFSTFSTFSFETFELFKQGNLMIALLNILISVAVGVTLIYFILKNQ